MGEIYRALEALAKYLGADPIAVGILLVLPLALMYFRFKYHQDVLKSPRGLAGVRERLAGHGNWRSAYFGSLRRVLTWVDCKLGSSAWSADSYEFTLSMAFIYPFASLLIVWVATGQNTSGISELLPSDLPLSSRALVLAGVCANAFFFYRAATSSGWRQWGNLAFASAFAAAGAVAVLDAHGRRDRASRRLVSRDPRLARVLASAARRRRPALALRERGGVARGTGADLTADYGSGREIRIVLGFNHVSYQ